MKSLITFTSYTTNWRRAGGLYALLDEVPVIIGEPTATWEGRISVWHRAKVRHWAEQLLRANIIISYAISDCEENARIGFITVTRLSYPK
jgi:hypothetical protein